MEVPDSELKNALDLFVASGLVLQEGEIPLATYYFKHALVQEAAYNMLPENPGVRFMPALPKLWKGNSLIR